MQQLLIDTMDLLDPENVRVAKSRRTRLMPIEYGPLPALSEYQRKLRVSGSSICVPLIQVGSIFEGLLENPHKLLVTTRSKMCSASAGWQPVSMSQHQHSSVTGMPVVCPAPLLRSGSSAV